MSVIAFVISVIVIVCGGWHDTMNYASLNHLLELSLYMSLR